MEQEQTTNGLAMHEDSSEVIEGTLVEEFDPVAVSPRHDGWHPSRQRAFIEALAECGRVGQAAARVGMTEQSARRLRRRPDAAGFTRAWDAAVRRGADRPQSVAYERAITGKVRRHYYRGRLVGEERVYDDRLLIYLLGRSDAREPKDVAGPACGSTPSEEKEVQVAAWCNRRMAEINLLGVR